MACWSSGLDTDYFIQYLEKIVQKVGTVMNMKEEICLWFHLKRHSMAEHFLYHMPKVIQLNNISYPLLKKTVGLRIRLVSNYAKRHLLVFEQFGSA